MTEASPGPGWWQASDGRWYPPHLHPGAQAASTQSTDPNDPHATTTATVTTREPIDWERVAAEREQRRKREERKRRWRLAAAVIVAIAVLGGLYLFVRDNDDGDDDTATTGDTTVEPTVAPQSTTAGTSPPDTTAAPESPEATAAPEPTAAPTTAASGGDGTSLVSVFDVQPGTCIDNPGLSTGLVTDLRAVPCEQPHSHEVYQKVTFVPADGVFDAERITAFANEQCALAFAAYVGVPYSESRYYFLHLAPSEQSWNQQGDRDVVCLLFLQGTTMTGSARGTAQ